MPPTKFPTRGHKNRPLIDASFWNSAFYLNAKDDPIKFSNGEKLYFVNRSWDLRKQREEKGNNLTPTVSRPWPSEEAADPSMNTSYAAHTHPQRLSNILGGVESPPSTLLEPPSLQDSATFVAYFHRVPARKAHIVITTTHVFCIQPLTLAPMHPYWTKIEACEGRDRCLASSIELHLKDAEVKAIVQSTFPGQMQSAVQPRAGHIPTFMKDLDAMKLYLDMHKELFGVRIQAYAKDTHELVHDSAPHDDDGV